MSREALRILERASTEPLAVPLEELEAALQNLPVATRRCVASPPLPFSSEGHIVSFQAGSYRLVTRLGHRGEIDSFKVVQIDVRKGQELRTFVAKVARDAVHRTRVLRSYRLAQPHVRHPGLAAIQEVADDEDENGWIALVEWIPGVPLVEFLGLLPLLAEEQQEPSVEALLLRWIRRLCEALAALHRSGLVHGAVSPAHLLVSGSDLTLTHYDRVTRIGERYASAPPPYYPAEAGEGQPASPSDDLYALAASLFHVLFAREPFLSGPERDQRRGLHWQGLPREEMPVLAAWLDRATHPDPAKRFPSLEEAQQPGKVPSPAEIPRAAAASPQEPAPAEAAGEARPQRIPWLRSLLQSYPGSRWGNRETRGLDSDFAAQTYVPTALEDALLRDIRERRARLIVLCGNAGDGKTALLQHLAQRLGFGRHTSSERVLKGRLAQGPIVRFHLDGSAFWQGKSADELLDAFLLPFFDGPPKEDRVHLLAINDGRLLEWIDGVELRHRRTPHLAEQLSEVLRPTDGRTDSWIRFVNLNQRSLVGGVRVSERRIDTGFVERLIDELYGGA